MSKRNSTVPTIRLLSTDIDGTLVGKPDALARFNATWESIDPKQRPLLCYNTGRLLDDTLRLLKLEPMLNPDYLICGVGTLIYDCHEKRPLKSFSQVLDENWHLSKVESVLATVEGATKQPHQFQNAYKSSWYLRGAAPETVARIELALEAAGIEVNVIYSTDRDLDIIPKYANKGNALAWLLKRLEIPREQALVAGDTGNDSAMFRKRGLRGIVVGNAQPELHEATVGLDVYRAEGSCADGILEGLLHFGAIERIVEPPEGYAIQSSDPAIPKGLMRLLDEEDCSEFDSASETYLKLGYDKAIEGLRRCITPMGFAACSLDDNLVSGTDENYRSVWARDGCITVIATLPLADEDIRRCQLATLDTLLDNLSITGLTPANVSIDTGKPDYSGVGGICSIDSGLWLVIACFEHARARGDYAFLRRRRSDIQRVMDWLSAHDSNNDGLLEVPEAGDWTDLFGRSYNVLYDEALWYRANVCYGRILEMLNEWRMAGDYLRWATVIKSAILSKFWPSTQQHASGGYHFADNQASMGDTHYLIAQVTPFSFDWRCDVYGNILAFLFDVLDIDRAQRAFRFMWGVGVADPFPVANLYPPVQSGDPGWRDYYTVNLLNLPNHYHNGGLWPFVGAQWVRFINKLGLRNLALQELVRLAKLNQAGIYREWEFNEWAHGVTGKPMGKAYQAWSCAEFIRACHDLGIATTAAAPAARPRA